jgi:hypothetical protein
MTAATWITFAVIATIVWGGFALALVTAIRRESGRGKGGD